MRILANVILSIAFIQLLNYCHVLQEIKFMCFLRKNIWSFSLIVLAVVFLAAPDAWAATVIDVAKNKAADTFKSVKAVIFIVGGFGLVALAFFAIFGKLKWTWFASLAVGLAILAAAGAIIDYATTNNGSVGGHVSQLGDSLTGTESSF